MEIVDTLNFYLALGGALLFLGSAILTFDLFTSRSLEVLVKKWGMLLLFLLTLGASAMTLVYSEIFGFVPCSLCWFQRIFLYPQMLLFGAATYWKDTLAARYAIIFSIPGFIIALYQHYLQMGGGEFVPCPVDGAEADCSVRILFEFGFMTFPLMSAGLFLFIIAMSVYLLRTRN